MEAGTVTEIAGLSSEGAGKTVDTPDGGMLVLVPPGWNARAVAPIDPPLTHIKQVVTLQDQASFSAYIAEHKVEATRLFVDIDRARLTAVFDYHSAAAANAPGKPDRMAHRAVLQMKPSEPWKAWTALDGRDVAQMAFARFLEEHAQDIVDPSGAEVLELATHLQAKKKVHFESGVRLQTGSNQITFKEEIDASVRGNMAVMPDFELGIPVFFNGDAYRVKCFLRFNIDDGKLTFKIDMHKRQEIYLNAVQVAATSVADAAGLTPFYGTLGGLAD